MKKTVSRDTVFFKVARLAVRPLRDPNGPTDCRPTIRMRHMHRSQIPDEKKTASRDTVFLKVAPPAGLEPATYGLTVRRSTN